MWEWQATCSLCGFESHWYRTHFVARMRAMVHSIVRHPFGHTIISAAYTSRSLLERR